MEINHNIGQIDSRYNLVHIKKAFGIAQPEGYIRIFVVEGPPMAHLLYDALSRDISPYYVQNCWPRSQMLIW